MMSDKNKKPILFVLSIDTEEEWDWSGPFPNEQFDVTNINRLTALQQMCDEIGIKPTYFVDYAVANNQSAAAVLKKIASNKKCEIGAHLHPWCNPPFFGPVGEKESHVVNLPIDQVEQKLIELIKCLTEQFGVTPKAFRTGRWGIDGKVLKLLTKHGFNIDSSVYPFYQNDFYSCQGAPVTPYIPQLDNPLLPTKAGDIFEIPVTAGYNHSNFDTCERIYQLLSLPAIRWTRAVGIAWHTRLLRKSYLSPELFDANVMGGLCRIAIKKGHPILHMFMHSSSLIDNNNSLVGNRNAYSHITASITKVITDLQKDTELRFCTISEAASILRGTSS